MGDDIKIEKEGEKTEDKLKKLKEQLKKCKKEKEEYLDGWQRAKADFINARKEEEKNRESLIKFSNLVLLADILPVLDSFDLAAKDVKDKGVDLIKAQLNDVFKKHGLETIKTKGEKFDPELHESLEEVESKKESGTIVEEVQRGYTLQGRVLRPAKVKIAK